MCDVEFNCSNFDGDVCLHHEHFGKQCNDCPCDCEDYTEE